MTELELKEAVRQARNAYNREWARKNPDKVRAKQQRYWERRALREQQENNNSQED